MEGRRSRLAHTVSAQGKGSGASRDFTREPNHVAGNFLSPRIPFSSPLSTAPCPVVISTQSDGACAPCVLYHGLGQALHMMYCSTVLRAQAAARVPFVCSPLSGARLVFTMLQVQQIIRATGEMPPERLDCKWAPKLAAKTLLWDPVLYFVPLCVM